LRLEDPNCSEVEFAKTIEWFRNKYFSSLNFDYKKTMQQNSIKESENNVDDEKKYDSTLSE